MKDILSYCSYGGAEPYIFLLFDRADSAEAYPLTNHLIDRQFRVCYHELNQRSLFDPEWLANQILKSSLAIFLLSDDSMKSLVFRNCINFAISRKKPVYCIIRKNLATLEYGFDMQLLAIPCVKVGDYPTILELCDDILTTKYFSQNMRGEDAKIIRPRSRRKSIAIGIIAASLILFSILAVWIAIDRVQYQNSFAYQMKNVTKADYLDISSQDASAIPVLEGKTIQTLVARHMGLTDVSGLEFVDCEVLDLSQNPAINTLEPLLNNKHLREVKVSQDMAPAISRISGRHSFAILITE